MSKKLYEEMTAGTMDDRSTLDEVTTSSQTIAKPHVGGSLKVGDTVYYHKSFPFIAAYVLEIKDNGFGVWIRFAKKINGLVIEKFVSIYDLSINYH